MSKMAALIPKTHFYVAKVQTACIAGAAVQICHYSQRPRIIKNPSLSNMKRGTGGRSSFNGIVCTVFGASGLVGKHLVGRLGRIGAQVICPYRGEFYDNCRNLKLCGDLGQILFHPFHLKDEESIKKCIKYSNVVVNLVGCDWETKNFTYEDVNVEGAARLARICKEMGVERFIHLSALNACSEPEPLVLPGGSRFLKSKFDGECAVKREFPDATIIRPAVIYGTEDKFLSANAHRWRFHFGMFPVYKKGEQTIKQPIWVGDVAAGIIAAMNDRYAPGRTYQFVGPHRYKLGDLLDWFHEMLRRDYIEWGYKRIDIDDAPLFKIKVSLMEAISPAYPLAYLHWEGLEKEFTTDKVIKGVPTIEDLGITPIKVDAQLPWEIKPYRFDGSYEPALKEYQYIDPPKPVDNVA